jgi:hypothetical protein
MTWLQPVKAHSLKLSLLVLSMPFLVLWLRALSACGAPWMRACRSDTQGLVVSLAVAVFIAWLALIVFTFTQNWKKGFVNLGLSVALALCLSIILLPQIIPFY